MITKNKLIIGKGKSETIILQKLVNFPKTNYEIILEEDSKLNYVVLEDENTNTNTNIILKKNAELNYYILTTKDCRQKTVNVELNENSKIEMKNIILSENQTQDYNIRIVHVGKGSISKLENKAILTNSSLQIKGNIVIKKEADNADGYQKSEILILKNSKAISIPDLEIMNNDVKCTHSSSITRLDEEKVFYLMTRGLEETLAMELLMNAFVSDDIKGINEEEKIKIHDLINKKISDMEKAK